MRHIRGRSFDFNAASRTYKKAITSARLRHIDRIGQRLVKMPSGTRAFWSLSKAIQGNFCRSTFPPLRKPDDTLAHTAQEKAEILCTLFASNSSLNDGGRTPPSIPRCLSSLCDIRFTQSYVRKALFSLDVNKASGPDGIPAVVLKTCAPELTPVLTRLFRHSYSAGTVPSSWKTALVHPVPKKGDKSDPANYRPIAVTSQLSKVMESLINNQFVVL
ncbi:jg2924 [Pararge aegeria aegeria]|uniref:Jg2924 protein n=1 Tax=Pararge aegeria aegeria TaxID=348720 RepID=A0A8S4SNI1_9NEOP|nr:jg2924 [Pararge aegeria aegeria]